MHTCVIFPASFSDGEESAGVEGDCVDFCVFVFNGERYFLSLLSAGLMGVLILTG